MFKNNFLLHAVLLVSVFLFLGCSQESKLKRAISSQYKAEITAALDKEFKGAEKSKLWSEFKEWMISNSTVEVSDVQIQDNLANGKLKVLTPHRETVGGVVLLMMFAAVDADKKKMGFRELWREIQKADKRTPAMADFPKESIEITFKAKNEAGWKLIESKEVKSPSKPINK